MWKLASQIGSQLRQGAEKVANQLEKIDLGFSKETASDLQLRLEQEAGRVATEEQAVLKKNDTCRVLMTAFGKSLIWNEKLSFLQSKL